MNACDQIQDLLIDYALEDIPPRDATRVARHLAQCEACQVEYAEIAGTGKALVAVRALRDIEGTEEFHAQTRFRARVEGRQVLRAVRAHRTSSPRAVGRSRRRGVPRAGSWMIPLAALVVLSVAGTILHVEKRRREQAARLPIVEVAELIDARGAVHLFLAGDDKLWDDIQPGQRLFTGDTLAVPDGIARLRLEDGSVLHMNAGSEVTFAGSRDAFQSALRLETGEIYVEVASHNRGFLVTTAAGRVQALGRPYFGMALAQEGKLEVVVVRGGVQIQNEHGTGRVGSRLGTTVLPGRKPSPPVEIPDLAARMGWRYSLLTVSELRKLFAGRAERLAGGRIRVRYDGGERSQIADWTFARGWKIEDGAFQAQGTALLSSRARFAGDLRLVIDLTPQRPSEIDLLFIPLERLSPREKRKGSPRIQTIVKGAEAFRVGTEGKSKKLSVGRRSRIEFIRDETGLIGRVDGVEVMRGTTHATQRVAVGLVLNFGQVAADNILVEGTPDPTWLLEKLTGLPPGP